MLEQAKTLVIHSGSTNLPNYPMFILLAIIAIVLLISYSIRHDLDKRRIETLLLYKSQLQEKQNLMKKK